MKNNYILDTELTEDEMDKSMLNGYFMLIHNESLNEAFTRNGNEEIYYPFNTDSISENDIIKMINHFASDKIQEFERCVILQQYMKDKKHERFKFNR